MWQRIRKLLAPPVFEEDEEKTRVARLLNSILLVVILLVMAFSIPALVMTPALGRILLELILALVTLGILFLMHRGQVNLAAYIFSFILWAAVTYGTYQVGGFRGSTMSSYFGIIMIAGMLLGGSGGIVFGVLSIVATGGMLYADGLGLLPPPPAYATLTTFWNEFSATVVGVVVLLAMTVNSLRAAITRARLGEKELAIKAREAQQLAQQAQSASQFKTSLIARVSHELRTPLGAILGMTEMLHYDTYGDLNEEQKHLTQRVIENSHHLERLIAELLEQSQIEAGRLMLRNVAFSPTETLKHVDTLYLQQAKAKKIALHTNLAPNFPEQLHGDPARVEQILFNLVGNALKFTHQGSVEVNFCQVDEHTWMMQVKDTGIGIAKEAQKFIFEPFRQADESTTREYGGVGLGLSIVKQLTEAMHGSLQLDSTPGHGSTFTVILPVALPPEALETVVVSSPASIVPIHGD